MRRILTFVTIMSLIVSTTVIAQSAEAHVEVVKLLKSHPETTEELRSIAADVSIVLHP